MASSIQNNRGEEETVLLSNFNDRIEEDFGKVYSLFYNDLFYFAAKLYRNTEVEPRDAIQDVFLSLWQSKSLRFERLIDIKAYLFVSLRNNFRSFILHHKYVRFYHAYVQSPEKRRKFDELCGRWLKLAAGQSSPDFKCRDIDGKEICLADFRGRYVYIDIWATWCLPCRGELPHLEKLARKMEGRKISFISLSCDQDEDAWKRMVKKEKLGGIQLYGGKKDAFIEAYVVRSIPRFILIDPRGNIVNADMSRPSDPRTAVFLEVLEGM